jgi:succinate dehydrogenase/fumarate reductase cytochrome b subunit
VTASVSKPEAPGIVLRVAPAIACLAYPLLVWCVVAVSPLFLPLTLLPPLVSVYAVFQHAAAARFRVGATVAHFGIGSPALYSLMGGWLDFQRVVPFHANAAWAVLWIGLAILTAVENPGSANVNSPKSSRLAFAHGLSAMVITLFAVAHLTNHLAGLFGGGAHIAVMHLLRTAYRNPFIETTLAACVLFQFGSGLVLLTRRISKPSNDWIQVLQGASGAYLALFLASHLSVVTKARYLRNIDTNWVWLTSSNLLTDAWSARLVPYYFLAIVALGLHGACGLRRVLAGHGKPLLADRVFTAALGGGVAVAIGIMVAVVRGSLQG